MKFVLDGKPLSGEALTNVDLAKGDMTSGFKQGKMFEVDSFKFKVGVAGEDDDTANARRKTERDQHERFSKAERRLDKLERENRVGTGKSDSVKKPSSPQFEKWYRNEPAKYPVEVAPVTFSRYMDKASTVLLQNTIRRVSYDSCTLIKRKAAGSKSSGEVYLRFDFTGVLMIKCDWSDSFPIEENYEFICRAVTVSYRPQLPDGTLGAVMPGFWAMPGSNLQPVNLKGD